MRRSATKETAARAMGRAKTHGQVALSMMAAETNRPMMPPAPANPAQVPIALACSSRGKLVVMTDKVTGMIIAAPTPARTRSRDEGGGFRRERRCEVAEREADQTDQEDRLASPSVTDGAHRHEQRGEDEGVAVDDPQQLALGRAEVGRPSACWATLRPETDATTATRATHMAARTSSRRRASTITTSCSPPGVTVSGIGGGARGVEALGWSTASLLGWFDADSRRLDADFRTTCVVKDNP